MSKKKQYLQTFRDVYSIEFPCIKKSMLGLNFALCTICSDDFKICYGGKTSIRDHLKTTRHKDRAAVLAKQDKKITSFFSGSFSDFDVSLIKAECLFTNFLIEHNLPLSAADHAGPLFRKMFPDSDISKKYACARTKTAAIVNVLATEKLQNTLNKLQKSPFSIAVDGSNDANSKIYPIVATFFDEDLGKITNQILTINPLQERGTGRNIAQTVLDFFTERNVPFRNCIAFGADNAPVMLGENNGVVHFLKEHHPELITIGCNCHLLNLAARKAASVLPVNIEQSLIDIFYYIEHSFNRKESLKAFQQLHDVEVRKILKHVPTRWLSLNKCLQRLIDQWQPLLSFFLEEVKKHKSTSKDKNNNKKLTNADNIKPKKVKILNKESKGKSNAKIPSASQQIIKSNVKGKEKNITKRKLTNAEYIKPKKIKTLNEENKEASNEKISSTSQQISKSDVKEKKKISKFNMVTREERIFYFLSSEKNKAYCYFLLSVIPEFEKNNVLLQSSTPLIHKLRDILLEFLKTLMLKFIKPPVLKSTDVDVLKINFKETKNQKDASNLTIGNACYEIVQKLSSDEKEEFYINVRKYFEEACSYILQKFPLSNEVIKNADIVNLKKIECQSFDKIRFFLKKFPLLYTFDNEEENIILDKLQEQFQMLQIEDLSSILQEEKVDLQLYAISKIKDIEGKSKFDKIIHILLAILLIPHSNAECERLFSLVRKNRTAFRSSMSDASLENLLIVKSTEQSICHETDFSRELLQKAKKATINALQKSDSN